MNHTRHRCGTATIARSATANRIRKLIHGVYYTNIETRTQTILLSVSALGVPIFPTLTHHTVRSQIDTSLNTHTPVRFRFLSYNTPVCTFSSGKMRAMAVALPVEVGARLTSPDLQGGGGWGAVLGKGGTLILEQGRSCNAWVLGYFHTRARPTRPQLAAPSLGPTWHGADPPFWSLVRPRWSVQSEDRGDRWGSGIFVSRSELLVVRRGRVQKC